jgi:hypothetical protein
MANNRLVKFKTDSNSQPFIFTVWGYGIFAIPAAKFTLEETTFKNCSVLIRAVLSDLVVLGAFSVMSGIYGYFGYAHDSMICGEYGFRFCLKYICVLEPARMLWRLNGGRDFFSRK